MTPGRSLFLSATAAAIALSVPATAALPYSSHIRLVAPADGATISWTNEDEIVTFSFHVDDLAILAQLARTGSPENCGTKIDFYVTCDGPGCKNGPPGTFARDERDLVSMKVSDLLRLTTDPSQARHAFVWGAELREKANQSASPPCISTPLAVTAARLTLERNAGPPRLALSLEPDAPSAWPKTITVTDAGGPSKATFLVVSVKTLAATDAVVARNCSLMDASRTHTVEAMAGGGSRRAFDVPPLKPSKAQMDALLKSVAPAASPTPVPGKTPAKAMVAPGIPYQDPNVHQMVTCQYQLDAKLGTDTNAADPNKKNNSLSRTIRIDVALR